MRRPPRMLQARRRSEGHRGRCSTPRPRAIRGDGTRRGRRAEGRPHASRPSWSWSRSASAPNAELARRRRHRGQSRHRGRRRARDEHRRHPRDRRMRRASRHLLRPGRARLRAGARAGRAARRARRALCRQRARHQPEGLRRQRVLGRRFPRRAPAPRRSCSPIPASASTRSSSSRTAGWPARCCSAIPRTALWYLDLIRSGAHDRAHPRRSRLRPRARRAQRTR